MSFIQLITQGRVDSGKLEKFADSCNSMARSFWMGHKVELLQEGKNCTLQTSGNGKTVTSNWVDVAAASSGIYTIGVVIAPIIILAYALACIPVAITMGIGLVAKKIALATDEHSYRYHIIVQKYLVFSKQDKKLNQLTETLKSKMEIFQSSQKELQDLENIKISGSEESGFKDSLDRTVKDRKESIGKKVKALKIKIENLNKNIQALTSDCDGLKVELTGLLEAYFSKKNEQFDKINF